MTVDLDSDLADWLDEHGLDATLTPRQARRLYRLHGLTAADLMADHGSQDQYSGVELLVALGY